MKIEIELGFSHIRDALIAINEKLGAMVANDEYENRASLMHLRDALKAGLPAAFRGMLHGQVARITRDKMHKRGSKLQWVWSYDVSIDNEYPVTIGNLAEAKAWAKRRANVVVLGWEGK